jgi:hypothetical protein
VYADSRRHNDKLLRVTDLTGSEDEHDSSYCLIADEHFYKDHVECPNRIPAIKGMTPTEALKIHLSKQKSWYEKPLGLISMGVLIGVLGSYLSSCFDGHDSKDTPQQAPTQPPIQSVLPPATGAVNNIPKKTLKSPPQPVSKPSLTKP